MFAWLICKEIADIYNITIFANITAHGTDITVNHHRQHIKKKDCNITNDIPSTMKTRAWSAGFFVLPYFS